MKPSQVTVEWLQRIALSPPSLNDPSIKEVLFRPLVSHVDGQPIHNPKQFRRVVAGKTGPLT